MNSNHDFKKAGIPRAGFDYQDLVAVEVLIDFLQNPNLYEWVQVEAEDPSFQAIDDVVACRKDGKLEFAQVKFTPDPMDPDRSLCWDWLTERKPSGTSLLQKWAKSVLIHHHANKLANAELKTDRIPDIEFAKCLENGRVNFERLSYEDRRNVIDQLGSSEIAAEFFAVFEFAHSQERFDDFEETLRVKLEYCTDRKGWAYFKQEVRRWAMRKNSPLPDGRIRHFHLTRAFSDDRPVALRQDFTVPPGYVVPDDEFHNGFMEEITSSDGISVLWGPPGRGKSTYLSRCLMELSEQPDIACIRHHYFLRLDEFGDARFNYFAIQKSLIKQLADLGVLETQAQGALESQLETASSKLRESGRRLLIVIDGLDVVWRNKHDISQMQFLFDALLPLPEGVRLVVGTQKVEDSQLPTRLLSKLPKDRWTELPNMSVTAVRKWLMSRTSEIKPLVEESRTRTYQDAIGELGSALHKVSSGLPLHLVYSLEALLNTGKTLTVDAVMRIPGCPSGVIEDYYETLWVVLTSGAKRVLHLLAGLDFGPPSLGLGKCLTEGVVWWQVLDEISHLLECREASVVPFHSSLFTFLRERPEHNQQYESLAGKVLDWLEVDAGEYWRRAWLWVMQADLRNAQNIVLKTSREWAIDWLVSGYPIEQLIFILNRAEEEALHAFDLRSLIRLRCLKMRALSARKYQTNDWESFWETSLVLSGDSELGAVLRDSLPVLETDELIAVVKHCAGTRSDTATEVMDELKRRDTLASSLDLTHDDIYSRSFVRLLAQQTTQYADRVISLATQYGAVGLIDVYTAESLRLGNYENVLTIASRHPRGLGRDVLAALCMEGIGPSARSELPYMDYPPLYCLSLLKGEEMEASLHDVDVSHLWQRNDDIGLWHTVHSLAYDVFFTSFAFALEGRMLRSHVNFGKLGRDTWLGKAFQSLERLAKQIGTAWLDTHRWPTLSEIFNAFTLRLPSESSRRQQSETGGIRFALRDIAVDLCLLGTGILGVAKIDGPNIRKVSTSPFWVTESWLETFYERSVPIHSEGGVKAFIDLASQDLGKRVFEFKERAEITTKSAKFALEHGLRNLSKEQLRNSADCLLAYGYHKDSFVFEVLEAIRTLDHAGVMGARPMLLALATEIEPIAEYTDGDGTMHARSELYQIIVEWFPERASLLYRDLISKGEWYFAEEVVKLWTRNIRGESPTDRMFLQTLISPSEFDAAWSAADGMSDGSSIRETLETLTGRNGPTVKDRHQHRDSHNEDQIEESDISAFEPGHLVDFVHSVRDVSYSKQATAVSQWLKYWDGQDRHVHALKDLWNRLHQEGLHIDTREAIDTAVDISLKRDGRTSAYPWLVLAMTENRGWNKWWSNDERFRKRVQIVRDNFAAKWREFIEETSVVEPIEELEENGITVGFSRLVYFLVEVGEVQAARECVMEMVDVFRSEVSQQPLVIPEWTH